MLPASEAASYAGDVALTIEAARRAAALPRGDRRVDQFTLGLLVGIGSLLEGDTAWGAPLLREAVMLAQTFDDPGRLASPARRLATSATTRPLTTSMHGRSPEPAPPASSSCSRISSSPSPSPRWPPAATPPPRPARRKGCAWPGRRGRRAASAGTSAPWHSSRPCRAARTTAGRTPPRPWSTRFPAACGSRRRARPGHSPCWTSP